MAGAKVYGIWHHSGERRRTDNGSWDRYWRRGHCTKKKLFKISEHAGGATSYAIRHLRNKHNIDVGADEVAIPSKSVSLINSATTAATAAVATGVTQAVRSTARTAKSLITTLNINRFRYLLIRWIVMVNICVWVVERESFREIMIHCCAGLEPYLINSGTTIKRWVLKEFKRQKAAI
jgi:hypothetical protein